MSTMRLRRAIEAGHTGDKSPGIDPSVAPLGTDEEAAGTPIPPTLADAVRAAEMRPDGERLSRQNATPRLADTTPSGDRTGLPPRAFVWLAAGLIAGSALALLALQAARP